MVVLIASLSPLSITETNLKLERWFEWKSGITDSVMNAASSNSPTFLRCWRSITHWDCCSISRALYYQIVVVSVKLPWCRESACACARARASHTENDYWTSSGSQSSAGLNLVPECRITKYASGIKVLWFLQFFLQQRLFRNLTPYSPSTWRRRVWIKHVHDLWSAVMTFLKYRNTTKSIRKTVKDFSGINPPTFLILHYVLL